MEANDGELGEAIALLSDNPRRAALQLREVYDRALAIGSRDVALGALSFLRIAYAVLGEKEEELAVVRQCALERRTWENVLWLARSLHERRLWEEALQAYADVGRLLPSNLVSVWRETIDSNMDRCCRQCLPAVIPMSAATPVEAPYIDLADAFVGMGDTKEACAILSDGLRKWPSSDMLREALRRLKE